MELALLLPVLLLALTFAVSVLAYSVSKITGREISLRRVRVGLPSARVDEGASSGMMQKHSVIIAIARCTSLVPLCQAQYSIRTWPCPVQH